MMKLVVFACVLAMASAGALISPLAYSTPYVPSAVSYTSSISAPALSTYAIPGTFSYAHAPAVHLLKKRSAAFIAPAPLIQNAISYAAPTYASPALSAYNFPTAINYAQTPLVHVLKKRSAPLIAPLPLNQVAVTPTSLVSNGFAYSSPIAYSSPVLAAQYTPLTYGQAPLVHQLKKREPQILPEAPSPI